MKINKLENTNNYIYFTQSKISKYIYMLIKHSAYNRYNSKHKMLQFNI